MVKTPIIVALDYPDPKQALHLIEKLPPSVCRLKIGSELFMASGPKLVDQLVSKGYDVFLDLKYHDIPNTVASACRVAASAGVWMLNVHAGGGERMLIAAKEAIETVAGHKPLLISVTVLTSLQNTDLVNLGINESVDEHVLRLAKLSHDCGLDGVVCSAHEAPMLRQHISNPDFVLVAPGIRMMDDKGHDQKRVVTPRKALSMGVDYLVIGRSITQAPDPVERIHQIIQSLDE